MDCPGWWKHTEMPEQVSRNWKATEQLFIQWLWGKKRIPGFIWHGPVGRGKTASALGLAYRAGIKGKMAQYVSCERLMQEFSAAKRFTSPLTVAQVEDKYAKPRVLIIDDVGTRERPADESGFLFDLLDRRLNEETVNLWTMNTDVEQMDGRILDRFNGYDVDVSGWGPSLRGRI